MNYFEQPDLVKNGFNRSKYQKMMERNATYRE
jgi:hypothetical protein